MLNPNVINELIENYSSVGNGSENVRVDIYWPQRIPLPNYIINPGYGKRLEDVRKDNRQLSSRYQNLDKVERRNLAQQDINLNSKRRLSVRNAIIHELVHYQINPRNPNTADPGHSSNFKKKWDEFSKLLLSHEKCRCCQPDVSDIDYIKCLITNFGN